MLAATFHLLLSGLDEVDHPGVGIELGIHGYCFHQHANGAVAALVGASVVYGVEQHLLLVIEFSQQISVGGCEDGATEHAVRLAVGVYPCRVCGHGPCEQGIDKLLVVAVGQQWRVAVAAIEVFRIPFLVLLKGCRLALLLFFDSQLGHRQLFRFQRLTLVGFLDIFQHDALRTSVEKRMMNILEIIEMLFVAQQTDAEQTVAYDVERLDHRLLGSLDVIDMFYLQREGLRVVDGLHRVALLRQFDAREQGGVGCHHGLDSLAEPLFVETAVEDIETRYVIARLSPVVNTFHVEAILGFS